MRGFHRWVEDTPCMSVNREGEVLDTVVFEQVIRNNVRLSHLDKKLKRNEA